MPGWSRRSSRFLLATHWILTGSFHPQDDDIRWGNFSVADFLTCDIWKKSAWSWWSPENITTSTKPTFLGAIPTGCIFHYKYVCIKCGVFSSGSISVGSKLEEIEPAVDFPVQFNFGSPYSSSLTIFFDFDDSRETAVDLKVAGKKSKARLSIIK